MRKRIIPFAIAATLIALAMLFILSVYGNGSNSLRVSYINVGQGGSIWLHPSDQTDILIDGGPRSAGSTVVAYLQNNTIDNLSKAALGDIVLDEVDPSTAKGLETVLHCHTFNNDLDTLYLSSSKIPKSFCGAAACPTG